MCNISVAVGACSYEILQPADSSSSWNQQVQVRSELWGASFNSPPAASSMFLSCVEHLGQHIFKSAEASQSKTDLTAAVHVHPTQVRV